MTRVVIAGGHGKIALILERLLSQRGDSVAGFIRNPAQAADLEAAGAEALVVDLEKASVDDVAIYLQGADAVVFAAGAGPGSGVSRKETVDRDAAILLADAAEAAGVPRYLMISSMGADTGARNDSGDPVFAAYLRAKAEADDNVRARAGLSTTGMGECPAGGLAAVLVAVLDSPDTGGQTFELISGDTPIADAIPARTR